MSPAIPDKPPTILVAGAGYLGRRFLERQPPATAVGINRSVVESTHRVAQHDLDTGGSLPVRLQQPYKILYTVPPASPPPDERLDHLLCALKPVPERLVYISTTGVYGDHGGATVDETTPVRPSTDRANARVVAEVLTQEWGARHDVSIVILRVPGIYGPTRLGQQGLQSGQPVIVENESGPGNRIHIDDLVSCCIAALADRVPGGIYNVGDGDNRSATWFRRELARQLGLPEPASVSMTEAERTFSPMAMSFLREKRVVDTRRMREILGITPRYRDAADGIAASLQEERS